MDIITKPAKYLVKSVAWILATGISFYIFLRVDFLLVGEVRSGLKELAEQQSLAGGIVKSTLDVVEVISALSILIYFVIHLIRILGSETRE